jgi:hypothetical protein
MRSRTLVAAIVAAGFAGGGMLYAQPGADPTDSKPAPSPGSGSATEPDLSLPAEKSITLSTKEMEDNMGKLIDGMEQNHRTSLGLQAQAKQAKDVIKLNCVNDNLLAVKQLLNIADEAKTDFAEAKAQGDRAEQEHQYSQVTLAAEKSDEARDEARGCIGDALQFIGKNDVQVDGPAVKFDPTKDGDVGHASGQDPYNSSLEDPAYASPFSPQ